MGLEWSAMNLISEALTTETITKKGDDTVTQRKNPFVAGIVVGSATLLLLACVDGGKGMVSKSFGKVCIECSTKL